jgi:hypothetical protein
MSDEEKRGYYLKMNNKKPVLDPQVKVGAMDAYVRTTKKRAALFWRTSTARIARFFVQAIPCRSKDFVQAFFFPSWSLDYQSAGSVDAYAGQREMVLRFPPTGAQLRDLVELAGKSDLTISGISDDDRNKRQIQSEGCSKKVIVDHTFTIVGNYGNSDRLLVKQLELSAILHS